MRDDAPMTRIVMATHASRVAPPSQSMLIAKKLRDAGAEIVIVGRGDTGLTRLLDTAVRGLFEASRGDTIVVDVFGHRAFVYEALSILYGRLFGRRVVAVLRGGWLGDFGRKHRRLMCGILSLPHIRIAPHQFLVDELRGLQIPVDRLIPNFIEPETYVYRERLRPQPRFLFLRGTHAIYNPELCLRAFATVQRRFPDASLTLAGGGPIEHLQRQVETQQIRNVRFPGLVSKAEIPSLAEEHDIYVQSNRVENMPVTVLEMWASGLPVVGTAVGGLPYLVRDGHNGLLVPNENDAALAAACLRILDEPGLGVSLARNGRTSLAGHTWSAVADVWAEVLGLPQGSLLAARVELAGSAPAVS